MTVCFRRSRIPHILDGSLGFQHPGLIVCCLLLAVTTTTTTTTTSTTTYTLLLQLLLLLLQRDYYYNNNTTTTTTTLLLLLLLLLLQHYYHNYNGINITAIATIPLQQRLPSPPTHDTPPTFHARRFFPKMLLW